jgi:hypothetical protein
MIANYFNNLIVKVSRSSESLAGPCVS